MKALHRCFVMGILLAQAYVPALLACERCPPAAGWELDANFSPILALDADYRFGNAGGIDDEGGFLATDLFARYWSPGADYLLLEGYSRSSDSYAIFTRGTWDGRAGFAASLQSVPWRDNGTAATPFAAVAPGRLVLPADWVAAPTTAAMPGLGELQPIPLGGERMTLALDFDYALFPALDVSLRFNRQERDGQRLGGGSMLFSATQFASPVRHVTDDMDLSFAYSSERWHLSALYSLSLFNNDVAAVTWDNPFAPVRGNTLGSQATAPDNIAQHVRIAGGLLLPARTSVTADLAVGRLAQDENLLPYTLNPNAAVGDLPVDSAKARVDTLQGSARIVTTPLRRFTLRADIAFNDRDNKTERRDFTYVETDTLRVALPARSTAFDLRRRSGSLAAEYRLPAGLRLGADVDRKIVDRTGQARSRTVTDRRELSLATRPGSFVDLSLAAYTEDRDGSDYQEILASGAAQNPLLRKYHLADRSRRGLHLRSLLFAGERGDIGIDLAASRDRYGGDFLGLAETDFWRLGLDASYLLSGNRSVYLSLHEERYEAVQAGSQQFSTPDWRATSQDRFRSAVLGATLPDLWGSMEANLEIGWHQSRGRIDTGVSGLATAFPDLRSDNQWLNVGVTYPVRRGLTLGLSYYHERQRTDDWALDAVGPASVRNLLSLGTQAWNYDVNLLYLTVRLAWPQKPAGR